MTCYWRICHVVIHNWSLWNTARASIHHICYKVMLTTNVFEAEPEVMESDQLCSRSIILFASKQFYWLTFEKHGLNSKNCCFIKFFWVTLPFTSMNLFTWNHGLVCAWYFCFWYCCWIELPLDIDFSWSDRSHFLMSAWGYFPNALFLLRLERDESNTDTRVRFE